MLRLLICDDAQDAREAVRSSLAEQSEIEVVAEAATGEEAIALAASHEPNVVLMDVQMPGLDGIAATKRIRDLLPKTRIVAYAGSDDADDVMAMMEAGADAYCMKGAPLWELERAIAGASDPLARLAHAIARSVSGGGTAELVARELAELTGASFAATYLATADTSLSLAALSGPGAPESLHSAPGVVARSFEELTLAQADTRELGELYRLGAACGEAIAAPLVADGQALGAVLVALPASVGAEGDPELVSAVADLASVALASERRLAMTYFEARRDALTGLANKRAFDEHLAKLLDPTRRDRPVSLVLFDLDGFKQVNDQQGHVVGDDVLREVGRVFMRVVRAEDEIFRVGGEEFALVVEGTARDAGQIAERMRFGLTQSRRGHRLPTASAGIASVPEHARDPIELQRKADIALYAAKLSGKNRVQIYSRRPRGDTSGPPDSASAPGREFEAWRARAPAARRGRRPCTEDPAQNDVRGRRHRGRGSRLRRVRPRADSGAHAGRARPRRQHARNGRAHLLPPAEGRSRDEAHRRRSAHRLRGRHGDRRPGRAARTRSCASRSARWSS